MPLWKSQWTCSLAVWVPRLIKRVSRSMSEYGVVLGAGHRTENWRTDTPVAEPRGSSDTQGRVFPRALPVLVDAPQPEHQSKNVQGVLYTGAFLAIHSMHRILKALRRLAVETPVSMAFSTLTFAHSLSSSNTQLKSCETHLKTPGTVVLSIHFGVRSFS